MVTSCDDAVSLGSPIILPREVWAASGHVGAFNDPLIECLSYRRRLRVDQIQERFTAKKGTEDPDSIKLTEITCGNRGMRGQRTEPCDFNMILRTYLGPVENGSGLYYLRPEAT